MGHSFGGAFTQILLDAGHSAAGIPIDGAAVKGIRAVLITEEGFPYAFTNNLATEASNAVYDRYAVPVSSGNDNILPPTVQRENYEKNAALDWALAPMAGDLTPP